MNPLPLTQAIRNADAAADRFLEGKHIPGVVYGVVAGGELVHARGLGTLRVGTDAPPDADSVFRIASMTKSFTAATILALRDDGHLRLDDPVAAFVSDLADLRGPTRDSPPITIRHLLTMTAGFPTDDPWGDRQQALDLDAFAALLRSGPSFAWTPGLRFEYSNLGYGILGRVIAAAGSGEYRDVIRERILEPLGMQATTYERGEVPPARLANGYLWRDDGYVDEPIDGYGALASMGGVFTSVRDLARWVEGFTDAFPPRDEPDGSHPLSRATRREMQQIQVTIGPTVEAGAPDVASRVVASGYGFGLFIEDDVRFGRIVAHSGGYPGFGSNMRWQPSSGLGVIVVANHRYAPATFLATELHVALMTAQPVRPRVLRPSDATLAARTDVERLLDHWDDALAARMFAMNVELDEPLARRRVAFERLRTTHGRLTADTAAPAVSHSNVHLDWWMLGEKGGRVRIELSLSPEPQPRIQTMKVTSVQDPDPATRQAVEGVVALINGVAPNGVADLPLAASVDRSAVGRAVHAAAARFAPVTLGSVIAATDRTESLAATLTFRLVGERGESSVRLAVDPATGEISMLELRTVEQEPPVHAD